MIEMPNTYFDSLGHFLLDQSNRRLRTLTSGGVGGGSGEASPYPHGPFFPNQIYNSIFGFFLPFDSIVQHFPNIVTIFRCQIILYFSYFR